MTRCFNEYVSAGRCILDCGHEGYCKSENDAEIERLTRLADEYRGLWHEAGQRAMRLARELDVFKNEAALRAAAHNDAVSHAHEQRGEIERLTRERDEARANIEDAYLATVEDERDRLRALLDEAFAILHIALPCPRPWRTESDDAKLRIFRNIAEDRR